VTPPSPGVRAIDHVGLTVPDIEQASAFLVAAFGAEVIYDMLPAAAAGDAEGAASTPSDQARLGIRPGARWRSSRVLRLGEGASIELFDYEDPEQREPHTVADLGVTHFGVYTDDIDATRERVIAAGGRPLEGPLDLPREEAGEGNRWLYVVAPWGGVIEVVTWPSPMGYEATTDVRRWKPAPPA
jgi:catechol 2,3-dioxygenase-like lactoylglutathione lyase family enzyme